MIKSLFIFSLGVAAGAGASYMIMKNRCESEIASVKRAFKINEKNAVKEEKTVKKTESDAERYNDIIRDNEYVRPNEQYDRFERYSEQVSFTEKADTREDRKEKSDMTIKPVVISPDEYGEIDDYEMISLIYYSDGILADDDDNPLEDIGHTVGFDSLNTFGEYEDDSVFVRNDRLHCYYEILKDERKYLDVVSRSSM